MPRLEDIGIPEELNLHRSIPSAIPVVTRPVEVEVLVTVYEDGAFVQEQTLEEQNNRVGIAEIRYVQASELEEQRQLEPACNAELARQRTSSKRSVQ